MARVGQYVGQGPRPKRRHARPSVILSRALSGLTNALTAGGLDIDDADRFARLILSRPGVVIGPKNIRYKGKRYAPAEFAATPLARAVTGARAEAQNKAAIESEAGYQQALAELGLQRDLSTTGLDEQRRRSILDFGDPRFAGEDSLLGGQASANPLSTARLLQQAYERAQAGARQQANIYGTLFGGGLQSGLQEAGRVHASQSTEATRSLEDLLAALSRQRTQAGQIYSVGRQGALQQAQQRLLASGLIHAAKPPDLKMGDYSLRLPWRPKGRRRITL